MTFSKPAVIGWLLFFASILLWVNQSAENRGKRRGYDLASKNDDIIQRSNERSWRHLDSLHSDYFYRIGYQRGRAGLPEEGGK